MADLFEHDPEIASIWIRRVLLASQEVKAIAAERVFDDIGVIKGLVYPFIYWNGNEMFRQENSAGTYRIDYQFDVRAVWRFAPNQASRSPCRPLTKAMAKAFNADLFPHFKIDGVGTVHECKVTGWYRPPFRDDGDYRVIEHGVSIYLVTST